MDFLQHIFIIFRKLTSGIGDIVLQLDGFNKQNESRKTCRPLSSDNIIFNSHHDIFQAILRQVLFY